jgi:anion-transporting  ArsA/GET3 family ATPase
MGELLTIGKVWELAQRPRHNRGAIEYDLVVLDGPASGQLAGLLAAPRTFGSIARVGPVARQGAVIDRMLTDAEMTGVVTVATPEQMAVSEALGLRAALRSEFGIDLAAVIVNRLFPSRFSAGEMAELSAAADDPAVRSARWLHGRRQAQQAQVARLRGGLGDGRLSTLPFLFAGAIGRDQIERLAERLEGSLA